MKKSQFTTWSDFCFNFWVVYQRSKLCINDVLMICLLLLSKPREINRIAGKLGSEGQEPGREHALSQTILYSVETLAFGIRSARLNLQFPSPHSLKQDLDTNITQRFYMQLFFTWPRPVYLFSFIISYLISSVISAKPGCRWCKQFVWGP